MDQPIDAVVTWVDGSDPKIVAKKQAALKNHKKGLHYIPAGRQAQRFNNNNEIYYCVHSIRKFMPWMRNIYLVTDDQRPEFLSDDVCRSMRISRVDHRDIFRGYGYVLPTFNSRTVETALHRIEGLADRYIYFNDDFLITNPVTPQDFFKNGKIVLRGRWRPLPQFGQWRVMLSGLLNHVYSAMGLRERSMAILPQYKAAQLAGLRGRYIEAPHTPYPVIKATLEAFFSQHPQLFEENIQYKFRSMRQFVTNPLAASLEVAKENYILHDKDDYLLLDFAKADVHEKLSQLINGFHKMVCLQNFEKADTQTATHVTQFLEERIMS